MRLSAIILMLAVIAGACGTSGSKDTSAQTPADSTYTLPDTLRVATLYSPMSYFLYRGDTMGYDYGLLREFVNANRIAMDITVAPSLDNAMAMLDTGAVDLIAYEVPVTAEYKALVIPCGPEVFSSQVVVQRSDVSPKERIKDVTDLVGKEVWVERNSKYQHRLENLNDELGGGIAIRTIDRDTLIGEDIVEMVSDGQIELAIVDNTTARLNRTYYPNVSVGIDVSFRQRASWAVRRDNAALAHAVDAWFNAEGTRRANETLLKKYFELSRAYPDPVEIDLSKGRISPYDDLFRKYAAELGWDWRLLAAQGFVESQFRNDVTSWAGARGIMQIMPSTARAYSVSVAALDSPEESIKLAARILKALDNSLAAYIENPDKRREFVIAAYNSGIAHIIDAIALARKYGRDSNSWRGNVENALLMKSDARYYNDPVVRFGYFRGTQTVHYVRDVFNFYNKTLKHIKK